MYHGHHDESDDVRAGTRDLHNRFRFLDLLVSEDVLQMEEKAATSRSFR